MRFALPAALALSLSGCAALSQLGLVPPASGSAHLEAEPEACGQLHDPVRRSDIAAPIVGAADYHVHQFANIGFGGRLIWGESFDEGGIQAALPVCGVNELCEDSREAFLCKKLICRFSSDQDACKEQCDRHTCDQSPPHGRAGLTDPLSAVLRESVGHPVTGYPDFEGWPTYNSFTHQQVYERWLRRAFDGGVKLIVMLAVTNEALCNVWEHNHACDDMTNADMQIDAAYELERFIDYQNDCLNNGNGWYRIARSPQEARRIIADGAMAVVLGMEVDTLFNCYSTDNPVRHRSECTAAYVEQQIDKYRKRGVRHLFPIHLFDNGFGGAAVSDDFFNFGNAFVNQRLFKVRDCSDTYAFRFGEMSGTVDDFLAAAAHTLGAPYRPYEAMKAHCNDRGLTEIGATAIKALMDHKMIIDVDHMSANSRKAVFGIAEERAYQGLVSGHTGFTEVNIKHKKHEGQLTPEEVNRLLALGGLLAPILNQGALDEVQAYPRKPNTKVANDCGNSSKAFAQAYLYAVDRMQEHADGRVIGVGFGSDFNGLVASPSPRFGPNACNGQRAAAQTGRVDYPIDTYRDIGDSMDRSAVGARKYDINEDGFAHAGMFPDFVADLEAVGLTDADLRPLFSAAEAYIQLWERVEGERAPTPHP